MAADLTCKACEGAGYFTCAWPGCEQRHLHKACSQCGGTGRRRPLLVEWDALKAERDQAKEAVRNLDNALRNAVKERGDALDERDRYHQALIQVKLDSVIGTKSWNIVTNALSKERGGTTNEEGR